MRDAIPVCDLLDQCNWALARDAVDRVAVIGPEEGGDTFLEWGMRRVGILGGSSRAAPFPGSRGMR